MSAPESHSLDRDESGQEFLTFLLGGEQYAIEILKVQEIREHEATTRIAGAPESFKGVVSLRGNIVPILDLRVSLGFTEARHDGGTVVIIVNIGQQTVGMVVDSVSDVVRILPDQMHPVPEMATVNARHLLGIGMQADRMIILLDVESVLRSHACSAIAEAALTPAAG